MVWDAKSIRRQFLEERAQAWAELHQQDTSKRLKAIIHLEELKDTHWRIKFNRNKMQNSKGLTQIKINKDGQETTIEYPDEMEKLII